MALFSAVSLLLVACGGDSDSDDTGGTGGVGATGGSGGTGGVGATGGTGGSGGAAGSNTGGSGAGGPCTYKDIVGKATITSIDPINGSVCPDPHIAMYDFAADDTTIPADSYDPTKYGMNASFESISLPGGKGLPNSCLDPSGIKLNAVFPLTRRIIQTGTCTPVIDVLTLDLSLCESQCP